MVMCGAARHGRRDAFDGELPVREGAMTPDTDKVQPSIARRRCGPRDAAGWEGRSGPGKGDCTIDADAAAEPVLSPLRTSVMSRASSNGSGVRMCSGTPAARSRSMALCNSGPSVRSPRAAMTAVGWPAGR